MKREIRKYPVKCRKCNKIFDVWLPINEDYDIESYCPYCLEDRRFVSRS